MVDRGSRTLRRMLGAGASALAALAALVAPAVALAADGPVPGAAIRSAVVEPVAWAGQAADPGPVLLLAVAGTLAVLALLSGPEHAH